jgi:streptogramin lyase
LVRRNLVLLAGVCIVLVIGGSLAANYYFFNSRYPCGPQSMAQKTQVSSVSFDAVTKFNLPQNRSPNAITTASDGSVWFGELGTPGVAHLYPNNGTLIEYRWQFNYPPASTVKNLGCFDWTDTWGIAIWNHMVWGSNSDNSSIVGLSPTTDTFQYIQLGSNSRPYTLAVGPGNHLWFTDLSLPARIGEVDPGTLHVTYHLLPDGTNSSSAYLLFQNTTRGYVLAISPYTGRANLFSFNPSVTSPSFLAVGGNLTQLGGGGATGTASSSTPSSSPSVGPSTPTSVAIGEGGIWLADHSSSEMAFFNTTTGRWTLYPTSTVPYIAFTLPYFDVSNGSVVWFNEHYGNRLGEICCSGRSLTEYSFSDPPAKTGTQIDNTLSIAPGKDRIWFTEWTANTVGFVNSSYVPGFSIKASGLNGTTVNLQRGSSAQFSVELSGRSTRPLSFQFSDSEQASGAPKDINFSASQAPETSLIGTQQVAVTIRTSASLQPGRYVAAITVTDGLVSRSIYLLVDVR